MSNLKVALVLGGGFAKGAYQFGFIKSLLNYLPKENVSYVSASSIGVLNGYALAADKMDDGERLWRTKDFGNIASFFKMSWKQDILTQIVDMLSSKTDTLNIPLTLTMCQVPRFQELYLELSGPYKKYWRPAMRASISFPVVSKKPTKFFKKYYIDGGLLDNIPIAPMLNTDADMLVILHSDAHYLPVEKTYYRNKIILDVDVTAKSEGLLKTFDIRTESLNKMVDEGLIRGDELGSMIFKDSLDDQTKLRINCAEYMKNDYKHRKTKQSLDTLGTLINELYCSLFIDDIES